MATEKMEWVEIIEPKTKEHMYANLTTGECVWDPPVGVPVKKTDNKQWWELFDQNTGRFYYYNATSQKTVWHRPQNCDIIPLAKLQTLKQNTEPPNIEDLGNDSSSSKSKSKESVATQTPGRSSIKPPTSIKMTNNISGVSSSGGKGEMPDGSPRGVRHHHHHHHRHGHQDGCKMVEGRGRRGSQGSWRRNAHSQELLQTSQSHHSSEQLDSPDQPSGYNSKDKRRFDSGRSSDSSSVSRGGGGMSSGDGKPPSLAPSPSTPLLKKRSPSQQTKANSFDINISIGGGYSLGQENRSGGGGRTSGGRILTGSSSNHGISRSQSFAQKQQQQNQQALGGILTTASCNQQQQAFPGSVMGGKSGSTSHQHQHPRQHGGGHQEAGMVIQGHEEEEDSMHEKYFVGGGGSTGRRSAESPMEKENITKNIQMSKLSPDYANFSTIPPKINQETAIRHLRDLSGSDIDEVNGLSLAPGGTWGASLTRKNLENNSEQISALKRLDQGTQSSLLDNRGGSQFLPLHHYILEQAKLSGCYRFGGGLPEETDSLNSEEEVDGGDEEGVGGGGGGGGGGRRVGGRVTASSRAAPGMDYDSDEFADDEAVGDDSSSQERPEDEDDLLDDEEEEEDDDPPYINTTGSTRYSEHHYSDAADYTDTGPELGSSLYCNSRMSQHTVRPTHHPTTPPPPGWRYTNRSDSGMQETQHTSLKRLREPTAPQPSLYSPILERSELAIDSLMSQSLPPSPFSSGPGHYEHISRMGLGRERKLPSESDIEKYAQDNLNIHKKGIFRKKFSVRELLSWSKDPIRQPMLVHSDKALKKEASELFKMVQGYMGDRKLKQGQTDEGLLLEMASLAHLKPQLRDELYIQICRQTTENPRRDSLIKGWGLMAICLYFFPPSPKFQAYLESYMNRHRDPSYEHFPEVGKWPIHVQVSHYASVSCKRLQRIGSGGKRPLRKPTLDEIEQARIQIFRPSMFGSTLEEVMELQKSRFPHYKLPWVQTTLSDEVLRLQGTNTEGIFRVSADVDEVTSLKQQLDRWERPSEYTDAHTPASLLKLWYRELYEPLIPDSLYEECIQHHDDAEQAAAIVETLPALNKMVLAYLIRFLQIFARPEVVAVTKMDASNLAMVMAPNCLRCCCQEPRVMYENARKEMAFIRTLILSMDTGFMQGVL